MPRKRQEEFQESYDDIPDPEDLGFEQASDWSRKASDTFNETVSGAAGLAQRLRERRTEQ